MAKNRKKVAKKVAKKMVKRKGMTAKAAAAFGRRAAAPY
jgi:hypothetical protein